MAHISKRKLPEKTERALKNKLVNVLKIVGRNRNLNYSLNELLTFTEGIMLAKRLAIIYLIHKEKSTLDISEKLNVSTSTIIKMGKVYDRGGYKSLEKVFRVLEPSLLEIIEMFVTALPSKIDYHKRRDFLD